MAWHDPDWLWLKAQAIAESNLDPEAVSRAGAIGLMQIMPGTFEDCRRDLRFGPTSAFSPKASAICGAWYLRRCLLTWTIERSVIERFRWAWASYNAGPGRVLQAQKKAQGASVFGQVAPLLPRETRDYVRRIERIYTREVAVNE